MPPARDSSLGRCALALEFSKGQVSASLLNRAMHFAHDYVGLHLGAEYNGDHGAAGPSMNELVGRYLREGTLSDLNYFRLLVHQVRCFDDPRRFYYDDVSCVRASGSHSSPAVYRENVQQSVGEIVSLVEAIAPRLIIVAGVYAYQEFTRQILPRLPHWRGDIVRTRNPSVQGHRGSLEQWEQCYRSFRTDLTTQPRPSFVRKWHLHATDAGGPMQLRRQ